MGTRGLPASRRPMAQEWEGLREVGAMSVHRYWLPQLFNWLAVVVLLSLGVLV